MPVKDDQSRFFVMLDKEEEPRHIAHMVPVIRIRSVDEELSDIAVYMPRSEVKAVIEDNLVTMTDVADVLDETARYLYDLDRASHPTYKLLINKK